MAQASVNALKFFGVAAHESTSNHALAEGTQLIQFRSLAAIVEAARYHRITLDEKEMKEYTRVLTITKTAGVDPDNATGAEAKESTKQLVATASQSMRVLRGQAAATVTLPPVEGETSIVAQASFLVDLEHWNSFADLVAKEDQRQTALDFHLSGPWPPYDFVRMQFGG